MNILFGIKLIKNECCEKLNFLQPRYISKDQWQINEHKANRIYATYKSFN